MKKLALSAVALFLALSTFAGDGGKKCCKKSDAACCKDPKCEKKCKESGTDCKKNGKTCTMDEAKKGETK
jgi:hypothetical protein